MGGIMLADDEVIITSQLEERLSYMGYNVVGSATSGIQAVDMAKELNPDIVLMDIYMPGELDGIEASRIIKNDLNIPIIFLTAYSDDELIHRAKEIEPYGYILKPFHPSSLKATIEIALHKNEKKHNIVKDQENTLNGLNNFAKKLNFLFYNTPYAIAIVSNKKFIFLNLAAVKLINANTIDNAIGKDIRDFFHNDYIFKVHERIDKYFYESHKIVEENIILKDNSSVKIEGCITHIRFNKEKLILCLVKKIEEKNDISQTLLEMDSLKGSKNNIKVISSISHELRNQINLILGLVEVILIDNRYPEDIFKYLRQIKNISGIIQNSLNDLQTFFHSGKHKLLIENKPQSLESLFYELEIISKSMISTKKTGIKFITSIENDINKNIYCDKNRLIQIFTNLISNAVKFTDTGFIKVSVEKKDYKTLLFQVQDTGIGIPKEMLESIFMPFIQTQETINLNFGGSGLGLAISKKLISLMGGEITAESESGKGSTFSFTLPYVPVEKGNKAVKDTFIYSIKNKNYKILIVEDDNINLLLAKKILGKYGFNTIEAHNGKEAVEKFKENPDIDLIIMDIRMPVMNGLNAANNIREYEAENSLSQTPIIALSAAAFQEDIDKGMKAGFDGYIIKPLSVAKLYESIKKYINTP